MNTDRPQTTLDSPFEAWQHGRSLRSSGNPAGALKVLRQGLATESGDYRLHDELGMALIDLNRPEEAIGSFLAALELKPDFDEACNKIGSAYASRGLIEPAAIWFLRARQLNPASTKYLYTYGCVLVQLDSRQQAAEVFDEWLRAEPENPVARHLAGAALGLKSIAKASPGYVRALFDQYAPHFDENLAKLRYCGPELVLRALSHVGTAPTGGWKTLDAGCGTGLVGAALKPLASELVGVDLSAVMLEVAGRRMIYDDLACSDIVDYLRDRFQEFDVIAAADLLTYIGDLNEFFLHAAHALRPGGFVITLAESLKTTEDYRLNPTGRFSHSREYLHQVMSSAGLTVAYFDEDAMRHESKKPIATWVAVGQVVEA
jgi:predicted TPR repeat methyltransferase